MSTLFEKIINREIPADIVYEDDFSLAFKDINPQAPVHILIIPKKPIEKLSDAQSDDKELLGHLMLVAGKIASELNLEAILPAPYWTTYPESIQLAGGVPVIVQTTESSGYRATVEQLEAARTDRTKLLVFVSPSNPTGAVYTPEQVAEIGRWAAEHGIWVVTDEIYEHLVYGDAEFASMPVLVPEIADRCVVVNGVAKTYAMTGWRVGWMVGPTDVIKAGTNLQSHATSNVANVSQVAALAAVTGDLAAVDEMKVAFDRRRRRIVELLSAIPGVDCPIPEGAFYVYPSIKGVLGKEIRGQRPSSSADLAGLILDEAEVAVVPGEAFGTPGYLRLSYATSDADIEEGVGRMATLLSEAR